MKKILVVDDSWLVRENLKDFLHEFFILEVQMASSASEGIKRLKDQCFDLVLCDYDMPEEKGDKLLLYLRENKHQVPFIFFTGNSELSIELQFPLIETVTGKDFSKLMAAIRKAAVFQVRETIF
ncbi:CheY-like chemotaxis protein [Bacteriovorax stolpii]|nr:response regulator [Bacteriovorax stolpii]TDP55580.1 CheY-like chemotaxis protein [Bacteriovorax stolpii]